jgi:hypothetical protein
VDDVRGDDEHKASKVNLWKWTNWTTAWLLTRLGPYTDSLHWASQCVEFDVRRDFGGTFPKKILGSGEFGEAKLTSSLPPNFRLTKFEG